MKPDRILQRALREGVPARELEGHDVLFHRGRRITALRSDGVFGGWLFFSETVDGASGPGTQHSDPLYFVSVAELAVAEPQRWPWDSDPEVQAALTDAVPSAMAILDIEDEDEAYDILCDGPSVDYAQWEAQRLVLDVAETLGYAVCAMSDEHGVSLAVHVTNPDVVVFDRQGNPVPKDF
jgi:hypothetical protein